MKSFALTACLTLAIGQSTHAQFINGIDVSNFQGTINWTSVKSAGIQFAFTKATEGVDFTDARFATNMTGASAAGVYVGPYHFARIDSFETDPQDAVKEANDFVDAIQPYYQAPGYFLRPVVDVETVPDDGRSIKPYLSQWVRSFIGQVRSRLGLTPIIYANTNYVTNYFESDLGQYDLWLANYNYAPPNVPPASADGVFNGWKFWQYTSSGSVSGIAGNVDRDVYKGTLDQLVASFQAVPPTADFNRDGIVDGADFLTWQRNSGRTGSAATFARGNANGDSAINAADLGILEEQFASAAASANLAAVPEPSAALLALSGALAAIGGRRFARRR